MGDFEKTFPASACRKKKIACSTNEIEKKILAHAVRKKKKCCKAISSFRELYKIPAKLQPLSSLAPLNSGFSDAAELLLHIYEIYY